MNMATASRRLLLGTSVFRIHRHAPATPCSIFRTLLNTPSSHRPLTSFPLRFAKASPSTRPHFHCYSSSAALDNSIDSTEAPDSHPWPEWATFLDRLKSKGYFDDEVSSPVEDGEGEGEGGNSASANLVGDSTVMGNYSKDLNRLKNACLSFARERFDIFKSLSKEDIQTVVECGCPSLFRKTVNSAKRLRAFVRLDEGDVCSACNLRGSCDRAYVILKESEAPARTVDIVRILFIYALDPLVLSGGEMPHGRERVEASARKLLSELIELSDTSPDPALPKPAARPTNKKERDERVMDRVPTQNVEMKRGDWLCSKCNFMNFARNLRCLECREEGPKRVGVDDVEMKKGDWNCPQCRFMNFARNTKCLRCQESRPKRQLNPGEWECPSCDFLNYRKNMVCLKCNCERPKDPAMEYEGQIWKRPR
ncbi:zinc finger protein VAR3, chloroplastic isoform X3 [Telopea speciosissima]|uniref:zinc finger protein VAR3, chloroplastic isoform X3 n=1 Tax=Telopea speciosissima TaxID=54955 RepID=UPI001CC6CFC9|nr:zinc finger protein VAR3, chloroplastic isoform X3 [Telopea speciosissima]